MSRISGAASFFDIYKRIMVPGINNILKIIGKHPEKDIRDLDDRKALKYLMKKYETNREYTAHYLHHMLINHKTNPQFSLYMESELGSLKRSRSFIKSLCQEFGNINLFQGKHCLDIGSSSGNSLIAFIENGAAQATGIEFCEGRYQTSLINIAGCSNDIRSKINIYRDDIQNEDIQRIGLFDIIFCNDVLEHVKDPVQTVKQICTLMKNTPDAFAYINLRNFQHPQNIIHEPHYDLPGMTLLSGDLADTYYTFCRNDASDYGVYHWMSFSDYERMFNSFGKSCRFYGAINPDISGINYIENEAIKISRAFEEFSDRINLDSFLKSEIEARIDTYLSRMRQSANVCRSQNDEQLLRQFYLNYVIFDINMIVSSE